MIIKIYKILINNYNNNFKILNKNQKKNFKNLKIYKKKYKLFLHGCLMKLNHAIFLIHVYKLKKQSLELIKKINQYLNKNLGKIENSV